MPAILEAHNLIKKFNDFTAVDNVSFTIEEGEVAKRLAAWAGIFATATAFAGIWGMNFDHMPELAWTIGYPIALASIFAVCFTLHRFFKRSGWL